jgi:hypothetical protein
MVERYSNLKEEVGGSIPGCEISFMFDKIHVRWSTTSCALALACRPSVSTKNMCETKEMLGKYNMFLVTSSLCFARVLLLAWSCSLIIVGERDDASLQG